MRTIEAWQMKAIIRYLDEAKEWQAMAVSATLSPEAIARRIGYAAREIDQARGMLLDASLADVQVKPIPTPALPPQDAVCNLPGGLVACRCGSVNRLCRRECETHAVEQEAV